MNIKGVEITKQQMGVFAIVWLCFLLSFVERLSIPTVLPLVSESLKMSSAQGGSYMTAFYMGYVATQLPGGWLTDRFGYRKVLLCSLIIMGGFTMLMSTVPSYEVGFLYRVLAGIGSGAVFSSCLRAIFDWFPGKGRGTAVGFFQTSTSMGLTIVNLLVPFIARDHGWRFAVFIAGTLPVIAVVFAWFMLKERIANSSVTAQKTVSQSGSFFGNVLALLKNKNVMLLAFSGFFANAATWGTAAWANTYMNKELHVSLVVAGAIMSTYGLAAVVAKPIAGILGDIFSDKKQYLCGILLLCFAPTLLWFGTNTNIQTLYILAPILGVAAYMYSPLQNAYIGEIVPIHMSGTAAGFVNSLWQLGSMFCPFVIGLTLDNTNNNYYYAFVMLALFAFLGGVTMMFIKNKK
ncbi:MAG: major facilitator superfamily 1 [Firmicutes bacterium]|nr:major facilitator superfamily 1 [Bacillota bacterium]